MATINASKWGYVGYLAAATHSTARDATTGTTGAVNPTSDFSTAISYYAVVSGRGSSFNIYRSFYYFDTTAITSTVNSCTLNITGVTNAEARVIVLESSAFGGDGTSNITYGDFNKLDFTTAYSSMFASWSSTGNNSITLNSTALSWMETYDFLILAVVEYDRDYSDNAATSSTNLRNGVKWSTSPGRGYLDYTLAGGTGPAVNVNGQSYTAINSWNGVNWANIAKYNDLS